MKQPRTDKSKDTQFRKFPFPYSKPNQSKTSYGLMYVKKKESIQVSLATKALDFFLLFTSNTRQDLYIFIYIIVIIMFLFWVNSVWNKYTHATWADY